MQLTHAAHAQRIPFTFLMSAHPRFPFLQSVGGDMFGTCVCVNMSHGHIRIKTRAVEIFGAFKALRACTRLDCTRSIPDSL